MSSPVRRRSRRQAPSRPPSGLQRRTRPSRLVAAGRSQKASRPSTPAALVHELGSCVTEADIVQVLYRGLAPLFGYDVVVLHGLEREGWFHSLAIDSGVLQDIRRRPLADSAFAQLYSDPRTTLVPAKVEPKRQQHAKGPGAGRPARLVIWVPVEHQGVVIGSVIYQSYRNRRVPATEIAFLDQVHRRWGVLIANASLNELTRNQARRLEALNSIARAMASTLDEASVLTALRATLNELIPVDSLDMVSLAQDGGDKARLLHLEADSAPTSRWISMRSIAAAPARTMLRSPKPLVLHEPTSSLWVPIREGGVVRGALGIRCSRPYAYEASTAAFLELVSDEVTLALRNARSYEAIEDQRRQLEVVNSIGRRLASSPDRWAILRKARYEPGRPVLVRHSPWARNFERKGLERERWNVGRGAAVFVSGAPGKHRDVSRSFVWVPVLSGDRITAMLSLQSYHDSAFDDWHVRMLQDVAAHVSLALANADHFAQAQAERARLEALHVVEMGVTGAADESQIAEAVFAAVSDYTDASHMVLAYLDAAGSVVGFAGDRDGPAVAFGPTPIEEVQFFSRLMSDGGSVLESGPAAGEEFAAA